MISRSPYIEKLEALTEKIPDIPIHLQHLFTQSHDMIVVSDKSGKFIWVNKFTETLLEYPREKLYSIPWMDLVHPDDVEKTSEEFARILSIEGSKTVCFSNRYLSKSGKVVPLCWNTTGVVDGYVYCIARHCELSMYYNKDCR